MLLPYWTGKGKGKKPTKGKQPGKTVNAKTNAVASCGKTRVARTLTFLCSNDMNAFSSVYLDFNFPHVSFFLIIDLLGLW